MTNSWHYHFLLRPHSSDLVVSLNVLGGRDGPSPFSSKADWLSVDQMC